MKRVLFVDDDATLLRMINRNMRCVYDLSFAESGADALELIADSEEFPVIVTDMQMPGMSGLQFIQHVEKASPDSICIMLTGNQDVDTASLAINEGKVFKFLNKPVEMSGIRDAVNLALDQYSARQAERELLRDTLSGAIQVLAEILETRFSEIGSLMPKVTSVLDSASDATDIELNLYDRLATRFAVLGLALLDHDLVESLFHGEVETEKVVQSVVSSSTSMARLLSKIPRLESSVSTLSLMDHPTTGEITSPKISADQSRANLLKISVTAAILDLREDRGQLRERLTDALPGLPDEVLKALTQEDVDTKPLQQLEVPVCDLRAKMILIQPLYSTNGMQLLSGGTQLTATLLERLKIRDDIAWDQVIQVSAAKSAGLSSTVDHDPPLIPA